MQVELAPLRTRAPRPPRGWVRFDPRARNRLRRLGLTTPESILDLPGEVVSGHRDRHVVEVRVPGLHAFLKKEHRVSWTSRLRNWRGGFGPVSLSQREAVVLADLAAAGVPVPRRLAWGEDGRGRAFLLTGAVRGAIDLPAALQRSRGRMRLALARAVGTAVARVVRAGFAAPDLTAKHVLVRGRSIVLVDWPRATRRTTAAQDWAALAGLHASLVKATLRDRLRALRAFGRALGHGGPIGPAARLIEQLAEPLRRRRSVREQRRPSDPGQRLRWVAGEALCVTRPLWEAVRGDVPASLRDAALRCRSRSPAVVTLPRFGRCLLNTVQPADPLRRLLGALVRRPVQSVAVRRAGLLFRLRRHLVVGPRVLAFGGRPDGGGFLLTKLPADAIPLREWLAVTRPARSAVFRRAGRLLRRCHDAGCVGITIGHFGVSRRARVCLLTDEGLQAISLVRARTARRDLRAICGDLASRSDVLRVVRGYDADWRRWTAAILGGRA
jgi:hypothetical protein